MGKKTVIITGANSGIGKEAALMFSKAGHTVIMACRNIERSKPVQEFIINESGNRDVVLMAVDMSSLESIRSFCNDFKKQFSKLDVLISNAAYFNHGEEYRLTKDNVELTFGTNVVGPFFMINMLKDYLMKSDDARVLNASSNIIKHFFSPKKKLDFNNLQGIKDNNYQHSVYTCYRNSKMALVMLTFMLAEKFRDKDIKVNALQINGARMSKDTLKKFRPTWRMIATIQNLFFPKPSFMAGIYYEICTSPKFKKTTGAYFNHKPKPMKPGPDNPSFKDIWGTEYYPTYAEREDIQKEVWSFCESIT